MSEAEPLVTVATFGSLFQAEMAQGVLEDEGINSFVADGESVSTFSGMTGGVKLQVAKSDFLTAERVLSKQVARSRRWETDDYGLAKSSQEITADPGRVREPAEEMSDEDATHVNTADETVDRAMNVAVLGLVLFPPLLHFYSLWLLFGLGSLADRVSPEKQFKLIVTWIIDLATLFAGLFLWPFCLMPAKFW